MSLDGDLIKQSYVSNDTTSVQSTSANTSASQTSQTSGSVNTVFETKKIEEIAKTLGLTQEEYLKLMNDPKFSSLSVEDQVNYLKEYKTSKQDNAAKSTQTEVVNTQEAVVENNASEVESVSEPAVESNSTKTAATTETTETAEVEQNTNNKAVSSSTNKSSASVTTETVDASKNVAKNEEVETKEVAPETQASEKTQDPQKANGSKQFSKADFDKMSDIELYKAVLQYDYVDSNLYKELTPEQQQRLYVIEYARNRFIYSEGEPSNRIDEWRELPDDEKLKFAASVKDELKDDFEKSEKTGVSDNRIRSMYWQEKMLEVQTATASYYSLDDYRNLSKGEQTTALVDFISLKNMMAPETVSKSEKLIYEQSTMSLNALKHHFEKNGMPSDNLGYEDVARYARAGKISLGTAVLEYLQEKRNQGTLTESEKQQLDILENKVSAEDLKEYGRKFGDPTRIETELIKENSEYASRYSEADSLIIKNQILTEYAAEKYKDSPEEIIKLMHDANECGNLGLVFSLRALAKNNKALAELLAKDNNIDAINANVNDVASFGKQGVHIIKNVAQLEKTEAKLAEKLGQRALKTASDEQMPEISSVTAGMQSEKVQLSTVDRGYEVKEAELQYEVLQNVKEKSAEAVKDYAAVNADKALLELQNKVLHLFTDDSASATKAAIEAGTITRFGKDNQVEGFKTLQNNAESLLPEDLAITTLNKLADQIADCDVSNQLDMHRSITGSKYDAVQEHAASNIYKYDSSVQADALKVTYESGNTAAIDAANLQLDKCDKQALSSMSGVIAAQLKAMEERKLEAAAEQIGKNLVSMDEARDPAESAQWSADDKKQKVAEYMQEFVNASPAAKFRMITKLQGVWQAQVITHIATYCPELLSSLISTMGSDLFQLQITPEIKNKIMLEMLRVPDMQADALEYFKNNPSGFSDDIKQTCVELMDSRKDPYLENMASRGELNSEMYVSSPDHFSTGGKISNREYYGNFKGNVTLWKRDRDGNFIC